MSRLPSCPRIHHSQTFHRIDVHLYIRNPRSHVSCLVESGLHESLHLLVELTEAVKLSVYKIAIVRFAFKLPNHTPFPMRKLVLN